MRPDHGDVEKTWDAFERCVRFGQSTLVPVGHPSIWMHVKHLEIISVTPMAGCLPAVNGTTRDTPCQSLFRSKPPSRPKPFGLNQRVPKSAGCRVRARWHFER